MGVIGSHVDITSQGVETSSKSRHPATDSGVDFNGSHLHRVLAGKRNAVRSVSFWSGRGTKPRGHNVPGEILGPWGTRRPSAMKRAKPNFQVRHNGPGRRATYRTCT
jgi:hypothetical protein